MGIPKIIFSPESHHPPHPCISGEIRHHPSAQLVVLFVVVSSFSRVVAILPSTSCLLENFTAPEFHKVARELSDPFFPSPSRSCVRARARRLCSAAARHRAASPPPIRSVKAAIAFLASRATSPCKTRVEPSRNRVIAKRRRAPAAVCSPPAPTPPLRSPQATPAVRSARNGLD